MARETCGKDDGVVVWQGRCVRACLSGWQLRKDEKASASSNHWPQPRSR